MPASPALPPEFITRPIAHRALHGAGRVENSRAACAAAIAAGYGIELDIQPAADGTPMVFHDYDLLRLTGQSGPIADRSPSELSQITLSGSDEPIPSLAEILDLVAGQVPLLIEIKDQDRGLGPEIGPLQDRVAALLARYRGPVAVMSFNPETVARFGAVAPDLPRGVTSCDFNEADWPGVAQKRRDRLAAIADFDAVGACFVSHDHRDLASPAIAALKAREVPVLCWTIRSAEAEAAARRFADNVTFEGYLPDREAMR